MTFLAIVKVIIVLVVVHCDIRQRLASWILPKLNLVITVLSIDYAFERILIKVAPIC